MITTAESFGVSIARRFLPSVAVDSYRFRGMHKKAEAGGGKGEGGMKIVLCGFSFFGDAQEGEGREGSKQWASL